MKVLILILAAFASQAFASEEDYLGGLKNQVQRLG